MAQPLPVAGELLASMTSVANTVAMTTFAVHTLQPLIFYSRRVREGGLVLGGIFFANGPLCDK